MLKVAPKRPVSASRASPRDNAPTRLSKGARKVDSTRLDTTARRVCQETARETSKVDSLNNRFSEGAVVRFVGNRRRTVRPDPERVATSEDQGCCNGGRRDGFEMRGSARIHLAAAIGSSADEPSAHGQRNKKETDKQRLFALVESRTMARIAGCFIRVMGS